MIKSYLLDQLSLNKKSKKRFCNLTLLKSEE